MMALSGSNRKLTIRTKRGGRQRPITLQFSVLQACLDGWTLDKFELVVQGVKDYQFVVGDFTTEQMSVSSVD